MNATQRCMLDFLQNIFVVFSDREVFMRACVEQGIDLGAADTDYRMFNEGAVLHLPAYVQASYNEHIDRCTR